MKRIFILLCVAVMLIQAGCVAGVSNDTTGGNNTPQTVSTTVAATEPVTEPTTAPTETQEPTEATTAPTEPEEEEPRQDGLRLNDEQLAYFQELFSHKGPPPVENYYNHALVEDFASIQEIDMNMFFEEGSPEDMRNEITQSECDYYNQNKIYIYNNMYFTNSHANVYTLKRLSYAFVSDVVQRYLGVTVPQMDMRTLVYNPSTGYYYAGRTGSPGKDRFEFVDGYYDEETGLLSLYYLVSYSGSYRKTEHVVTLRYIPEADITKFQLVSNLTIK